MQFKEWIQDDLFLELSKDLNKLPFDNIKVQINQEKYNASFEVNGDWYLVNIEERRFLNYQYEPIEGIFLISFKGPDGFKTTNKNFSSASLIYNHVVASVIKFIKIQEEISPVNGFLFGAYVYSQQIIYDYFYKIYLKPAGYFKVTNELYLKKDYLKELIEKGSLDKQQVLSDILKNRKENLSELRKSKILSNKLDSLVGKLIKLKNNKIAFLDRRLDRNSFYVEIILLNRGLEDSVIASGNISDDQNIDPNEARTLLNAIRNSIYYNKINTIRFDALAKQYGLPPKEVQNSVFRPTNSSSI